MHLRPVCRVERHQSLVRGLIRLKGGIGRIVAKLIVFYQMPNDVDSRSIYTTREPEPNDVVHCSAQVKIPPVEIRLGAQERVAVILPSVRIEFPGTSAELGLPVIWRPSIPGWVVPDVPVTFGAVARCAAFDEPRMLIRSVIRHQIKDNLYSERMCFREQRVKISQSAEDRIDVDVVGHVIAKVGHWGWIDR